MFLINERFVIDPATGTCGDKLTGTHTRLEPRIMQLLLLLTEKPNQVISRESLVSRIWNDYGGGDEGLTQGISALRKALSDESKQLIRTLPKKGYCFTGQVASADTDRVEGEQSASLKRRKNSWYAAAAVLALVVAGIWFFSANSGPRPVTLPADFSSYAASRENETNSISAKDKNNVSYKLVVIGDRPPVFYRGDSIVPVGQWEPYQDMINYLKTELARKQGK